MSDERVEEIIEMISMYCDSYLNDEIKELNIKLTYKLASIENSPLKRGKLENWACAILYSIAQLNFLFNRAMKPNIYKDNLCYYFNTNQHTMWIKSRDIRRLCKLKLGDEEFSTKAVLSLNIPESKNDLKRIRTFDEATVSLRQRHIHDPDSVKNIKLANLINGVLKIDDETEYYKEIYSLLRSSRLIYNLSSGHIRENNSEKFKILLFTSMKEFESYKWKSKNPFVYVFSNILEDMENENFESAVINPGNANFILTREMINEIYPYPENINYYSVYF